MTFSLHPLIEADLDAVNEVVKAAYKIGRSRKDTLSQYIQLQPDGAFVVKEENTIVGFGAALDYGEFAYIGLMSVHPAVQKRGVGRLLMDRLLAWLAQRECATVLLDASDAGAPLYLHYGLVEEDRTLHLRRVQDIGVTHFNEGLRPVYGDFAKLIDFDTAYFGASREALLHLYIEHDPQRVFVSHDSTGNIRGYLIAQTNTIGPWVACSVEDAEQLLRCALTLHYEAEPAIFVSGHNEGALALVARYGFEQARSLGHMRKGVHVDRARRTALFGQASLGFG